MIMALYCDDEERKPHGRGTTLLALAIASKALQLGGRLPAWCLVKWNGRYLPGIDQHTATSRPDL